MPINLVLFVVQNARARIRIDAWAHSESCIAAVFNAAGIKMALAGSKPFKVNLNFCLSPAPCLGLGAPWSLSVPEKAEKP
jgi:hypothetical protein